MKTNKQLALTIIGVLIGALVLAQGSEPIHKNKMQALSIMTGEWSGSGWMMTREQQRVTFTQKESIRFELSGTVLQIRGEGFDQSMKQIHNALGIMYFDEKAGNYMMSSFLDTGQRTMGDVELTSEGLNWWFKTEQGATIKYIIKITDGKWNEKGYYSPDGVAQYPFIEFNLEKIKD